LVFLLVIQLYGFIELDFTLPFGVRGLSGAGISLYRKPCGFKPQLRAVIVPQAVIVNPAFVAPNAVPILNANRARNSWKI
jgi:hypothetical protein